MVGGLDEGFVMIKQLAMKAFSENAFIVSRWVLALSTGKNHQKAHPATNRVG
jgi:hypothetical protein